MNPTTPRLVVAPLPQRMTTVLPLAPCRFGARSPRHLTAILLAAGAVLTALPAQTLPAPPHTAGEVGNDPAVQLSPFVVQTSANTGYEATESLAGTGLATKLTDLGAAVSVVTSKFFKDTGSTDLRDVLIYQTNVEVNGLGGNFSGSSPALGGITGEPSFTNNTGTRLRGLAAATQGRNFYRSLIPLDAYNTDRLEINRGANSILFGVGSPAGIINYSTVRADPRRPFGEAAIQADNHKSRRGNLDLNFPVVRDQLALRLAAVADHEKFQQEPAFNTDERTYLALEWRVRQLERGNTLSGTTVRANWEEGRIDSNNPRTLTPVDQLSWWFEDTLPAQLRALGARPKIAYDPRQDVGNQFTRARGTATLGVIQNVNRSPTFVFQAPAATAPRDVFSPATGTPVVGRPFVSNRTFFAHTGTIGTSAHAYVRESSRSLVDFAYPDAGFFTSAQMTDPSIFNFYDHLIDGPNKQEKTNFRSKELSLEQVLFQGRAGFELAYNLQSFDESLQSLIPSGAPYISVDVNSHLWTGEVNPNFGRPFISTAGSASYNQSEVETSRAKAFYRVDFADTFRSRWGRALGRHTVSALTQREKFTTEGRGGGSTHFTPDFWANGSNQSRAAAQSKQIVTWHYIGDSVSSRTNASGLNLPGLTVNRINFQDTFGGRGLVISRTIPPSDAIALQNQPQYQPVAQPLTVIRDDRMITNTVTGATLSRRTLDAGAFALQSNWLADHLVSTVGWRKEESSTFRVSAPADPGGEGYVLVNHPTYTLANPALVPQVFEDTLFSWSVVAKTPRGWLRRVPLVSAFNVFYGVSENFDPPASQTINAFGRGLAPPNGETKEYGAYVELAQGKITAKLNFFETTQTGSFNGAVGGIAGAIVGGHASVYNSVRAGNIADRGDGFPASYVAPPQALLDLYRVQVNNGVISSTNPGVQDTSDFTTKGLELEVMLRPTRGLSFIFNAAKQESVRTNTGAATRRLLFETPTASGRAIADEWRQDWAYRVPLNTGGLQAAATGDRLDQNTVGGNFQRFILNNWNANAIADGGAVHELRKWRANAVANYDFAAASRLRGWGVGGAVRWQDQAAIGSPVALFGPDLKPATNPNDPGNIRVQDVRNPLFGPSETNCDAWVSYKRKIWSDRVSLKVQLNVRNLTVGNELKPIAANPDGSIAVWQIEEPRRYTLSATFGF